MAKQYVQVPASLIERVQLAIREGLYPDAPEWADLDHQLALLSQPTPTAEQVSVVRCFNEQPHEAHDWTLYYAQPPSDHRCPGVIFNATAAPHTPFCVRTSTPDNPCRCWKSGSTDEED